MERHQFTLDEANALVPLLEETFQRWAPVPQEHPAVKGRPNELWQRRRRNGSASTNEELGQVQKNVDRLTRQIEEGVQELLDRGIIIRDLQRGLVDFPSQREGREVFLCWIGGEERIEFWHETDRGFAHRQPL